MTTNVQTNYYLEVTVGGKSFACQVYKLAFTPCSKQTGTTEYPACAPTGNDEPVVISAGANVDGSAQMDVWHDTTPQGMTTALIAAQQAGTVIDYTLVWRFEDPTADYEWSGRATVQPIALGWDKSGDRTHRGPIALALRTSTFGRPAAA